MPTEVVMPQMGESITEGTLTKWLKKPGDTVQRDEPLFEISTDKVDAEIPSPTAGTLEEIKIAEGTTVQINTVVCTIADGASATAPAAANRSPRRPPLPPPTPRPRCRRHPGRERDPRRALASASPRRRHRRPDAADGRVHHRGHHHQVAQEGRRHRPARRADLRDLHRQGRRRDSLARRRHRSPRSRSPRARPSPINTVVAVIGGAAGKPAAAPARLPAPAAAPAAAAAPAPVAASASADASACAPRRWSARSPRTTTSISPRSPAPVPPAASPRPTSSAISSRRKPQRRCSGRALLPLLPLQPQPSPLPLPLQHPGRARSHDQDALHHRAAHGRVQAHQPARPHRLQGGHDAHRRACARRKRPSTSSATASS